MKKKASDPVAYQKGYDDAVDNKPIENIAYPGSRLSYLLGYKQHLLDHAEAIERDIESTRKELGKGKTT